MKIYLPVLSLLIGIVLSSCQKQCDLLPTGANNNSLASAQRIAMAFKLNMINPTVAVSGRVAGGLISWKTGSANASEVRFRADGDTAKIDLRSKVNQVLDLFDPLATFAKVPLQNGSYKEIRIDIELAEGNASVLELVGAYNTTPIIFRVSKAFEIETKAKDVTVSPNVTYTSLTSIDLNLLTQGITGSQLDSADKNGVGAIVISESSNPSLYAVLFANLLKAAKNEIK